MKITQTLDSGVVIRQDFRESVRFVMFETGVEGWEYATHGGTAFVICFHGHYFGITCKHVLGDFGWRQIALTDAKFGQEIAGLQSIFYPSDPTGAAEGSDILDIAVVQFAADNDASFFKDCAYIIDGGTVGKSEVDDQLQVSGVLKDQSVIGDNVIAPVFGLLEFTDRGSTLPDPTLREAAAHFEDPDFERLTGLSGSPVFNVTRRRLCGVVARGNLNEGAAVIWYIDFYDVMQILVAILDGSLRTQYNKTVVQAVASS